MARLKRIPLALRVVLGTLILIAGAYLVRGDALFSPGPLHDAPRGRVEIVGVRSHADLSRRCSACHAPLGSDVRMESLCLDCHVEVRAQIDQKLSLHGRLTLAENCRSCHTEHRGPQALLTDLTRFDHSVTAFPLTGKHLSTSCAACHAHDVYSGTPQTCVACHAEPQVHLGKFGADCASCHSTASWRTMELANFDHSRTAFPLTGKHETVACSACHKDQVFRGTPQSCVDCHAEPKIHLGRFGTSCASCHSTATWANATITAQFHKFPINHGGGRERGQCATCHKVPENYQVYTCYGCHKHDPERTAAKHSRIRRVVDLNQCATCHPRGK